MPQEPDKSVARKRLKAGSTELQRGWYRGQVVKYFVFDETALSAAGSDTVPVSPIYVTFNVNPAQPNGGLAWLFRIEAHSEQPHNVPSPPVSCCCGSCVVSFSLLLLLSF